MQKSHQDKEDEASLIKTEQLVMEKTDNLDMKATIKKDEEKAEEKVKEKAEEKVKDVKEEEVKEKDVKEEEVKEKEVKEEEQLTKEESVGEERKLVEEKKVFSCSLPPGWMFNLGGKVAKFTFAFYICKAIEIDWLSARLQDQMAKCSQACDMPLLPSSQMGLGRKR